MGGLGREGGCQFIVEGPDFPGACVVNSVYYCTVYPKRGQELLLQYHHSPERRSSLLSPGQRYLRPGLEILSKISSKWSINRADRHPFGLLEATVALLPPLRHPLPASPDQLFPLSTPAYIREPSLTLNLCFCITGLVCFFSFIFFPQSAGPSSVSHLQWK